MNWIKTFEELDFDTYRRASRLADYYNKKDKAAALSDYADKQQFGFYDIHISTNSGSIIKNGSFTEPELIGIYTGERLTQDKNILAYQNKNRRDDIFNKLVEDWKNGTDVLGLSFEFGFRATKELLNTKNTHSHLHSPRRGTTFTNNGMYSDYTGGKVPLFSLRLQLSDWNDGIEEWDAEAKWEMERRDEVFEPSDVFTLYDYTKSYGIYLNSPGCLYYGIFGDRKSAQKFKSWLLSILDDKIKDSIVDVLTLVSSDANDIEKSIESFRKIRIHGLYDDSISDISIQNVGEKRWYDKKL